VTVYIDFQGLNGTCKYKCKGGECCGSVSCFPCQVPLCPGTRQTNYCRQRVNVNCVLLSKDGVPLPIPTIPGINSLPVSAACNFTHRLRNNATAYAAKLAWRSKPLSQLSPGFQSLVNNAVERGTVKAFQCNICRLVAGGTFFSRSLRALQPPCSF
jgi:hypothetical protein